MQLPLPRTVHSLILPISICLAFSSVPVAGQAVVLPNRAAVDVITARVQAQAALIEAEARRNAALADLRRAYSEATLKLLDAESKAIDVNRKKIKHYYDKKENLFLEQWKELERKLENSRKPMVEENAKKVVVWERTLNNDLDRIRPGIYSGDLINRLFTHLDAATGMSSAPSIEPALLAKLPNLEMAFLKNIRLTRASANGPVQGSLVDPLPPIFECWPFAFYEPSLHPFLQPVNESIREIYDRDLTPQELFLTEERFRNAHQDLQAAFINTYPISKRRNFSLMEHRRIFAAERFLSEIRRTVMSHAERQHENISVAQCYVDKFAEGNRNIVTLIHYVMNNGFEIGPARTGAEPDYLRLFIQTRQLAIALDAGPQRESIMEPMMNLELDDVFTDETGF